VEESSENWRYQFTETKDAKAKKRAPVHINDMVRAWSDVSELSEQELIENFYNLDENNYYGVAAWSGGAPESRPSSLGRRLSCTDARAE
jgi:hypothetical protein